MAALGAIGKTGNLYQDAKNPIPYTSHKSHTGGGSRLVTHATDGGIEQVSKNPFKYTSHYSGAGGTKGIAIDGAGGEGASASQLIAIGWVRIKQK